MDPQGALYARTLQQVQDQQRVANAKSGVASSPFGAGLEGDASRNFNIDWQNQQLQRMIQGGGALSGLGSSIGQLGQNASQLYGQSSLLPYQTSMGLGQDQLGLLNTLGQAGLNANTVPQQQIQDYLQYLQAANSAQGTANQASGQINQQQQQLGQGLGAGLSQISNQWNQIPFLQSFQPFANQRAASQTPQAIGNYF
jgi:hypothetical protein